MKMTLKEFVAESNRIERISREPTMREIEACSIGVKMFVEKAGKDLDAEYTLDEVIALTRGNFGAEKFAEIARNRRRK